MSHFLPELSTDLRSFSREVASSVELYKFDRNLNVMSEFIALVNIFIKKGHYQMLVRIVFHK